MADTSTTRACRHLTSLAEGKSFQDMGAAGLAQAEWEMEAEVEEGFQSLPFILHVLWP